LRMALAEVKAGEGIDGVDRGAWSGRNDGVKNKQKLLTQP